MNEQRSPSVSHDKATVSPVPLSDWRSLHELASRVRQHEPWRILTETDLFALEDPVTKKVGLISVRGRYGEVYGIELYLPPEGLLFWLQLFRNGQTDPTLSKYELRKLDATFVSRDDLEREDLVVLEQLDLGRPKKRYHGYAQFRSYRPGCMRWYLDADEVRLIRIALGASMEFAARRSRQQEPWLLDDSTGNKLPVLSVYSPVVEPPGWHVRRERIQVNVNSFVPLPIAEILDGVTRSRLKELSLKQEAWQTGSCYLPIPAISEGRPVYTIAGLVIDESAAEILEASVTSDLKIRKPSTVVQAVAAAAIKRGGFPNVIKVNTDEERSALESLRDFWPELRIQQSKYLESLDFFMSELDAAVTRVGASKPGIISKIIDALREKRDPEEISKLANSKTIYHLKIALRHSDPPIWRTLQVSGDVRLSDLHQIFQIAMGWCNEHLHDFRVGSTIYGDPTMVAGGEDENLMILSQIAPRKASRFVYTYDFGDNWVHDVLVQRIERGVGPVALRCTGGQIACPPEDCGGLCGYYRLLESLANPADPNRDETMEWFGEDYDPAYFNPDEVNDIFASFAED
jgi:Plasmid pRiA4b ORF-3-like protein